MTAIAVDRSTPCRHPEAARLLVSYPVAASSIVYKGALVMLDAGYAKTAAAASGVIVVGVAESTVDNSAGSNGTLSVLVSSGNAFRFVGSGIVAADVGKPAYLTDNQTVQDAVGTYGIVVGVIEELESANVVWVYIPPTNVLALTGVLAAAVATAAAAPVAVMQHAIDAGDIVAGHYDFDFAFTVGAFSVTYRSAAGVPLDGVTDGAALNSGNVRISLAGTGAPALVATDVVAVVASA